MDWVKGRSGESLRAMIERARCSVTTVSGRDWTSASVSRLRASVSKRPCGLSAAPRPLIVTCRLSMSLDPVKLPSLDGSALLQTCYVLRAIAMGGEYCRGVLSQLRSDRIDVPRRVRELGHDAGHLDRRAVLEPDFPDHVPGEVLRVADYIGHAVDLAVGDLRIVENSHQVLCVVPCRPRPDRQIELIGAFRPPGIVGKRRVL